MNLVDKRIKNLYGDQFGVSAHCVEGEKTQISITLPEGGRK